MVSILLLTGCLAESQSRTNGTGRLSSFNPSSYRMSCRITVLHLAGRWSTSFNPSSYRMSCRITDTTFKAPTIMEVSILLLTGCLAEYKGDRITYILFSSFNPSSYRMSCRICSIYSDIGCLPRFQSFFLQDVLPNCSTWYWICKWSKFQSFFLQDVLPNKEVGSLRDQFLLCFNPSSYRMSCRIQKKT